MTFIFGWLVSPQYHQFNIYHSLSDWFISQKIPNRCGLIESIFVVILTNILVPSANITVNKTSETTARSWMILWSQYRPLWNPTFYWLNHKSIIIQWHRLWFVCLVIQIPLGRDIFYLSYTLSQELRFVRRKWMLLPVHGWHSKCLPYKQWFDPKCSTQNASDASLTNMEIKVAWIKLEPHNKAKQNCIGYFRIHCACRGDQGHVSISDKTSRDYSKR